MFHLNVHDDNDDF